MSLLDLPVPAPIHSEYVRRVERLTDDPEKQPRVNGKLASRFDPEFIAAIKRREVTLQQAMEAGMSSSNYYRTRSGE